MSANESQKSIWREYLEAIAVAVLLALFIRTFVFQAFKIPSGSMLPTLKIGDHLLVNKFNYGVKNPFTGNILIPIGKLHHGDVVVFRFPKDRTVDYIKRIVGVEGDVIQVRDKKVFVNNQLVEDPHTQYTTDFIMSASEGPRDNFGPVKVPEGDIFVMGDNRDNSYDSRFWGFVDQRDILGKASILYWSWDLDTPLLSFNRFATIRWGRLGSIIH